jgi:hypothetical protein
MSTVLATNRIEQSNGQERRELSTETQAFELAQRKANILSKSSLVPKDFQNNLSNCYIAMNMAQRLGADVLMVMQNLYIVHGRPGWSSQFLIATFNMSGRFSAMRFEFSGTPGKPDYGCRAWAIEKDSGQRLEGTTITMEMAKSEGWLGKNGSKWQTMPDQMLRYRAASFFVRAYAPEISMGLHTVEELQDISGGNESPAVTESEAETPVIVYASKSEELAAKIAKPAAEQPKESRFIEVSNYLDDVAMQPNSGLKYGGKTDAGALKWELPSGKTLIVGDGAAGEGAVDTLDADALDQVTNIINAATKKR